MYSLHKQYTRFWKVSYDCLYYFSKIAFTDKQQIYIFSSGILNRIWQAWNQFWRVYWLVYILGGLDMQKSTIKPSHPILQDEREAVWYILYMLDRQKKPGGKISGSYQEPTWGDIDIIKKLSFKKPSPGFNVLNAFSVLGDAPKHLQIVRNAAIHLDKDNMDNLKRNVIPSYVISKIKYPTDIIFVKELVTGKIAFKSWIDDLNAFLQLI